MVVTTKHLAVFWILIAGLLLLLPDMYLQAHGITKLLFEGYSYGKLMAFLLWEIFFFAMLTVLPKTNFKHNFNPLTGLGIAIFIGLTFGICLQLGVNSSIGISQHGYLGVLTEFNNITTWEASHLGHIHLGKVAIAPFAQIGLIGSTVDNGIPMFETLPLAPILSVLFILIAISIFGFALLEVRENKPKIQETLLLSIAAFACIVTVLDGGIFTQVGKISIGLIVLYWATKYTTGNLKFINQIIYPLGSVLLTQTLFALFANYETLWSTEAYVVLTISLIVIACEAFGKLLRKRNNAEYGKIIVSLVLLYFLCCHLNTYLLDYSIGSYPSQGDEVSLFLYGIPKTATDSEVVLALEEYGPITKFERWSWTARADVIINNPKATNVMAEEIKEKLKPDSYFYIVRLWEEQTIWVIDPTGKNRLDDFESEFVALSRVKSIGEKTKYGFKTKMDPVWTNLYLLDYLKTKGEKTPITLVTDWFE